MGHKLIKMGKIEFLLVREGMRAMLVFEFEHEVIMSIHLKQIALDKLKTGL